MMPDHCDLESGIQRNFSLKAYNTLAIDVSAQFFAQVTSLDALKTVVAFAKSHDLGIFIIGEGSNLVLTGDISALVLKLDIKGIEPLHSPDQKTTQRIKVGAGECWDDFVAYTIKQAWYGLENLSLIPGTVGASPVQNIGAYGVEVSDLIAWVECFDIHTGQIVKFQGSQCGFGYRDSRFKRSNAEQKGYSRYVIIHVVFDLQTQFIPNVEYAAFDQILSEINKASLSASQVRQAVIDIRSAKLPDPSILANAGSFFKNPVISGKKAHKILEHHKNMPFYPVGQTAGIKDAANMDKQAQVKVAAGWLIEQAGWKGRKLGPVGMHEKQALVLVNHGNASAYDIRDLTKAVMQDVKARFDIDLEPEPVHFP